MSWALDFVQKRDGVVLVGDPALAVVGGQEFVLTESKEARALARHEQRGRAQHRPVHVAGVAQGVEEALAGTRFFAREVGEVRRVDEQLARLDLQTAGAAYDDIAVHAGTTNGVEQLGGIARPERHRAHDGVVIHERGSEDGGVAGITRDECEPSRLVKPVRVPGDPGDAVSSAHGLVEKPPSHISSHSYDCDLHSRVRFVVPRHEKEDAAWDPIRVAAKNGYDLYGMRMSDRLHEIAIFVRAAEKGSFSVAARELGMSQPSVSRTVAALEERLGVTLLLRNTRRIALTDAGRVLLVRGRQLLDDADDVEEATRGASELRGYLRVAATQGFGVRELVPLLPEFLAAHPKVKIELNLSDRFEDLIADRIDVAFRLGRLVGAGFSARRIQALPRSLVASPRYLERRGKPTAPAELPQHDCIGGPGAMGPEAWSFRREGSVTSVTVAPRVVVASSLGLVATAVQGMGITIVAHDMARAELASGALVRLLTDHTLDTLDLHAVYPAGRRPSPKARAFAEHVALRLPSLA